MKIRSNIKSGALSNNHNQGRTGTLPVKTRVHAGPLALNHLNGIKRIARCGITIAVFFPLFTCTALLQGQDQNSIQNRSFKVLSPDASVFGHELEDWSAEWQKWYISIPAGTNPALHNDVSCSAGQSGPVWYLPSGVDKPCIVPRGKILLLTLINAECSSVEAPPFFGRTEKAREECAERFVDGTGTRTLKLTIDGVRVRNLSRYPGSVTPIFLQDAGH